MTDTPKSLLAELTGLGVTLRAEGGRLRFNPASAVTEDLKKRLAKNKDALLAFLTGGDTKPPETNLRARATCSPEPPSNGRRLPWPEQVEWIIAHLNDKEGSRPKENEAPSPGAWSVLCWAWASEVNKADVMKTYLKKRDAAMGGDERSERRHDDLERLIDKLEKCRDEALMEAASAKELEGVAA